MTSAQRERPRVRSAGVASAARADPSVLQVRRGLVPSAAFASVDSANVLVVHFSELEKHTIVGDDLVVDVLRHQLFAGASGLLL